ncbi:MAG: 3-deoxy-manno-octulosonate cytidylyltransferase [Verrucomicrobiota bacterium]
MMNSPLSNQVVAVIPARFGSTRFPGKILAQIAGKPMIQHVWQRISEATTINQIIIATDDQRIEKAALDFGAQVVMTDPAAPSGTDRVAEAVGQISADWIINVQGDEPLIDPGVLDDFVRGLGDFPMATLARQRFDQEGFQDPNQVKVVFNDQEGALYFSRAPVPCDRDGKGGPWWHHLGIYAYRPEALMRLVALPPSSLEKLECLEQLRALENGIAIQVMPTTFESIGVDTPEDIARVEALLL